VSSASSTPRRRDVRCRSRQGDRKGKDYDPVRHRTLSSLHAWAWTPPRQPPRELQRQIRDPAVSSHGSLLLRTRKFRRKKEINFGQNKTMTLRYMSVKYTFRVLRFFFRLADASVYFVQLRS
jgi:hypothetical protein